MPSKVRGMVAICYVVETALCNTGYVPSKTLVDSVYKAIDVDSFA